jgi:hypothetical protein
LRSRFRQRPFTFNLRSRLSADPWARLPGTAPVFFRDQRFSRSRCHRSLLVRFPRPRYITECPVSETGGLTECDLPISETGGFSEGCSFGAFGFGSSASISVSPALSYTDLRALEWSTFSLARGHRERRDLSWRPCRTAHTWPLPPPGPKPAKSIESHMLEWASRNINPVRWQAAEKTPFSRRSSSRRPNCLRRRYTGIKPPGVAR